MANNQYGIANQLAECIGETVTIYTTSGGQSGCGFTGVILSVNCSFVRLITRFGSAPSCALGSSCGGFNNRGYRGSSVGSVCDIPIERIACFVHNAV